MNENRGLWRGKDVEFGKWVEGNLVISNGYPQKAWINVGQIITVGSPDFDIIVKEVVPSTLGECTGLRDKNGKPIFEGDIVKVGNYTGNLKIEYGVVRYDNKSAVFFVKYSNMENYLDEEDEMEVISNIHDNPELLKTATGEDNGNAAQCGLLPAT